MGDSEDADARLARVIAAAVREQVAEALAAERIEPKPAPVPEMPPGRLLSKVCEQWAKTKGRLRSFKCDLARAHRLLGIEPFVIKGKLHTWAPIEGPFAGVRLADRDAMTLSPEDLDLFRSWFYGQTTRRKRPPSVATVNRYIMVLKRMVNFSVSRRTLTHSTIEGYEDEDEDNARAVVIEEEGFDLILAALGDNVVMRAFVTLAYDSGMRKTELLYARAGWLDQRGGRVYVPGAVAKNGEARIADLTPRAWEAIKILPKNLRADFLFVNPETEEPYDGRWVHELFIRAVERSGVVGRDGTPPRLHDLRRSWITLASRRGISDTVIMSKSGHKDHKVFRRYRIVAEKDVRESFAEMEKGRQTDLAELAEKRRADPHRAPDRSRDQKPAAGDVTV